MLNAFFNLNAQIVAISIMSVCYLVIFTEKVNRAIVALFGAALMIVFGVLSQIQAIRSVDFNTINLLIGMMVIIAVMEKTGVFQFSAIWIAKKVKANPRALLAVMTLLTGVLSGFIDNVTTVLLMTPIVIQITKTLEVRSFPYLMLMIFSSNIGGAATLIGDPPNILIGSKLGLSFMDFIYNMLPISYLLMIMLVLAFDVIWGRKLHAAEKNRKLIMKIDEKEHLADQPLLKKSLFVLGSVICGFVFAHRLGLDTGTIAIMGATALLFLYTLGDKVQVEEDKMRGILGNVDWITIFFFAGLFVIVAGLEVTGLLDLAGHKLIEWTEGSFAKLMFILMWSAAGLSSFIDNIPFVATMIPIVGAVEPAIGGREAAMPLWWALLMGACYGGNGTIVGASANVVVAGIAAKNHRGIGFVQFMLWGIPVMIATVVISTIYAWLMYL